MPITKRIKLDGGNLITFGARIVCCNERIWANNIGTVPFDIFYCQHCGRPLAVVGIDRKMYYVGEQILGREVDADNG